MKQWEWIKLPHNRMGKESRAGKLEHLKGKRRQLPLACSPASLTRILY